MGVNIQKFIELQNELNSFNAELVAVSKLKPSIDIMELYNHGQKCFGENYVQELITKQEELPTDIKWHFIGHLQSKKVKTLTSFVELIHGVDSVKLLSEINKQAALNSTKLNVLLQVHISQEVTKFGFDEVEMETIIQSVNENIFGNVFVKGFMGMASFTDNTHIIKNEFKGLKKLFDKTKILLDPKLSINFKTLSMGMTNDYKIALEEGSNMVRIGSAIFGERNG